MWADANGLSLPSFAFCDLCGVRHVPSFRCAGGRSAGIPPGPGRLWWYRGSDTNVYTSRCPDCALRLGFEEALFTFRASLLEVTAEYRDRGGHLELNTAELVPTLVQPARADIPPPPRPLVHHSLAASYRDEESLSGLTFSPDNSETSSAESDAPSLPRWR